MVMPCVCGRHTLHHTDVMSARQGSGSRALGCVAITSLARADPDPGAVGCCSAVAHDYAVTPVCWLVGRIPMRAATLARVARHGWGNGVAHVCCGAARHECGV